MGRRTWSVTLLPRGSGAAEGMRIAELLRKEAVGGVLLLAATGIAMGWAKSPWGGYYQGLRDRQFGPAPCSWTCPWARGLPTGSWRCSSSSSVWS